MIFQTPKYGQKCVVNLHKQKKNQIKKSPDYLHSNDQFFMFYTGLKSIRIYNKTQTLNELVLKFNGLPFIKVESFILEHRIIQLFYQNGRFVSVFKKKKL